MPGGRRATLTIAAIFLLAAFPACFKFEKDAGRNAPPTTFFDLAPADTTFSNEAQFSWLGTDLDSDVVAYQYQLVETDSLYYFTAGQSGTWIRSIDPRREYAGGEPLELWTEPSLDNFTSFSDLNDGWYEMRARSIDDRGEFSESPARRRFYVFFDDIPPEPVVVSPRPDNGEPACGRIGSVTFWIFFITGSDRSRNAETPREALQYSYQLRALSATSCSSHLTDAFTEWKFFPPGDEPIVVGDEVPTLYTDLFDPDPCGWNLTLRVRDPANNTASTICCISHGAVGCQ